MKRQHLAWATLYALFCVAVVVFLLSLCGCSSTQTQPSFGFAYVDINGKGDIRWDPVKGIMVGHVTGEAAAGAKDFLIGADWPVVVFHDGKRRIINRKLHIDMELGLDEVVPAWCLPYFPDNEPGPEGSGYIVGHIETGEVILIAEPAP